MPHRNNHARILLAHRAAFVFAITFTVWTALAAMLVVTVPDYRSARLGFGLVAASATVCLWTLYLMIRRALPGTGPTWVETTLARAVAAVRRTARR